MITLADLPGRPCAIAASLEVVGDRWAMLVVREVGLGNHRFSEIVRGTGAPRDRIAARLKDLVDGRGARAPAVLRRAAPLVVPPDRGRPGAGADPRAALRVGPPARGRPRRPRPPHGARPVAPGGEPMTTTDWGPESSRTVTWHDPLRSAAVGMTLPGIDYLRAMVAGEVPPPPIAQLLQFDFVEAEPGRVVFTCTPDASAYNPIGAVHGGLVCTLLDSVTGCAVHSTLPGRPRLHLDRDQGELPQGGPARAAASSPPSAPWSRPAPASPSPRAWSPTPRVPSSPPPPARCWSSTCPPTGSGSRRRSRWPRRSNVAWWREHRVLAAGHGDVVDVGRTTQGCGRPRRSGQGRRSGPGHRRRSAPGARSGRRRRSRVDPRVQRDHAAYGRLGAGQQGGAATEGVADEHRRARRPPPTSAHRTSSTGVWSGSQPREVLSSR